MYSKVVRLPSELFIWQYEKDLKEKKNFTLPKKLSWTFLVSKTKGVK